MFRRLDDILDFSLCCNELRLLGMLGWGEDILHVDGDFWECWDGERIFCPWMDTNLQRPER